MILGNTKRSKKKKKGKLENAPLSEEKVGVSLGLQKVLVFFLISTPPV